MDKTELATKLINGANALLADLNALGNLDKKEDFLNAKDFADLQRFLVVVASIKGFASKI